MQYYRLKMGQGDNSNFIYKANSEAHATEQLIVDIGEDFGFPFEWEELEDELLYKAIKDSDFLKDELSKGHIKIHG